MVTLPGNQHANVIVDFDVNRFLESFGSDQLIQLNSYSPVVQKRIGSGNQKNISITGRFRTNYEYSSTSYYGGFSFIQVRKNSSGKASAYSGYGIAWRPSAPDLEALIGITLAEASDLGLGYYDITHDGTIETDNNLMYLNYVDTNTNKLISVPFHYAGSEAGILTGCHIPMVSLADISTGSLAFMAPNLYIVDNDPVHGDTYASKYVVDPLTGLAFIQAATVQIDSNATYYFRMDIDDDNALHFYLAEDAQDLGEPASLMIQTGSAIPVSEYLRGGNMDSFGLSVFDTGGYQWWYDDIKIAKLSGEYSVLYFRFDATDMSEMLQLELSAYGESSDSLGTPTNGIVVNVWNPDTITWDNILTAPLNLEYATMVSNIIARDTYTEDSHILFMVTTRNPSRPDAPSAVYVDYVKLVRSSVVGMHVGGCIDLYVDDPGATYQTSTATVDADSYYVDVSGYMNISSIWMGDVELMYSRDYVIVDGDPGTFNTTRSVAKAKFTSAFAGQTVTIYYWMSANTAGLQGMLESDDHRPITTDVLVRHKRIHEITVSESSTYAYLVQAYLDALTYEDGYKILNYSDLVKYIYNTEGQYPTMRLLITTFDNKKRRVATLDKMGQEYPIGETETFRIMS